NSTINISNTNNDATLSLQGAGIINAGKTLTVSTGSASTNGDTARFVNTIDGPGNLVITGTGTTVFNGSLGSTTALQGLVTGSGGVTVNGNVTTTGAQIYNGTLLAGNSTLSVLTAGTGNDITLAG